MRWIFILLSLALSPTFASEPLELANQAARDGNYAQAYCIWLKLAKGGNGDAQHSIGWMYHNGYGMAINDDRAAHWWDQAAQQNHIESQFDLGQLYFHGGIRLKRNRRKALDYFFPAAVSGHDEARLMLTTMSTSDSASVRRHIAKLVKDAPDLLLTRFKVTGNKVNLRGGPGTNHKVVGNVTRNTVLAEISRSGEWLQITEPVTGKTGWIFSKLVKPLN